MSDDGDQYAGPGSGEGDERENLGQSQMINNQHFDEALDVSDDASLSESLGASPVRASAPPAAPTGPSQRRDMAGALDNTSNATGDDDSDGSDGDGDAGGNGKKSNIPLYDATQYASLEVTPEIRDLFQYIQRHAPEDVDLETRLKPFIPDYIPSVGEIDSFLKVRNASNVQVF
jgi:intraflagellar transport protein 46